MKRSCPSRFPALLFYLVSAHAILCGQVTVSTAQYSNNRTNANLNEIGLYPSKVNTATFGKLFSRQVDDSIYALPLYIPNVAIPGRGTHNVVYVVTVNNTVYAFDADDPAQSDRSPRELTNMVLPPRSSFPLREVWSPLRLSQSNVPRFWSRKRPYTSALPIFR